MPNFVNSIKPIFNTKNTKKTWGIFLFYSNLLVKLTGIQIDNFNVFLVLFIFQ